MKATMVLLMSLTVLATAMTQEKMAGDQKESWIGFVVDARYVTEISQNPATIMQRASEYTKAHALESGVGAGFGIITKGQWLRFDDEGNAQALGIIQNTERTSGFFVKVLGKVEGERIIVTSIEEMKAASPGQFN
jgi:hypothetical protein